MRPSGGGSSSSGGSQSTEDNDDTFIYTGSSDYGIYYIPSVLRSVTITGETVLSRGAFQNCSILQTLRINSGAQESIGTDALSNTATVEWI